MESPDCAVTCFVLLFIASSVSPSLTTFNCPSLVNTPVNGSVQLVCNVSNYIKDVQVSYHPNDTPIISTHMNKYITEEKRIMLRISNTPQQSTAALHINDVKVSDARYYFWFIEADGGYVFARTELRIEVPYSNIKVTLNRSEVLCQANGGNSEGQIQWLDGYEKNWTKSAEMVSKKTEDGYFNLSSVLPLKPLSIMEEYCCIVVYELMGKTENMKSCITTKRPYGQVGSENSRKTYFTILIPIVLLTITALVVYFHGGKCHIKQDEELRICSKEETVNPSADIEMKLLP